MSLLPSLQSLLIIPVILVLYILKLTYTILIRPQLSPVSRLPGPKRPSFVWGSMGEVFRSKPGDWHEKQIETYGTTLMYKGFMNTNRFCTVDTRALNHILARPDIYQKPPQVKKGLGKILGHGLLFAEGDDHRKQRKIMNPSFSLTHIRSLLPAFYDIATHVRDNWLAACPPLPGTATVNVLDHMSRMALDIIGTTGFDYEFNALSSAGEGAESENELSAAFATVLNHPGGYGFWDIIVNWIGILELVPTGKERRVQHAVSTLRRVGSQLIAQKKSEILAEIRSSAPSLKSSSQNTLLPDEDLKSIIPSSSVKGKDLLTLLIRANMASDLPSSERLSDEDVISQISTFVVAGHETTSTSLSWTLLSLADHWDVQEKLREEILSVGERPSLETLEGMKYLDAVVREAMRWNSIVPSSIRTCTKDDVVPLGDGRSVRVQEGDGIFIPIVVLNRLKEVWGPDAHIFRPERWLEPQPPALRERQKQVPGVWSDLMTFIGGPRSCIGVKFAVVEMKVVLHTLLRTFKIKRPEGMEVIPRTTIVTRPMVKGREHEGNMMPLVIERVE